MKNTFRFLGLAAGVAAMLTISSCGKKGDDATPSGSDGPKTTIVASGNASYLNAADGEYAAGDEFRCITNIALGKSRLTKVRVSTYLNGTINASIVADITGKDRNAGRDTLRGFTIPANANSYKVVITAIDSLGKMDSLTLMPNLTHILKTGDFLSAPNSDPSVAQCFLQASTATPWTAAALGLPGTPSAANQAAVDLVYGVGATAGSGLLAPDNFFTDITNYNLSSWTTKNATELKVAATSFDIDKGTTAAAIAAAFTNGSDSPVNGTSANNGGRNNSRIFNLTTGSAVAFKTVGGKYGVIKITSETSTGGATRTGRVEYTIKVQK